MDKEIIMNNWIEFHPVITKADLGWSECGIKRLLSSPSGLYFRPNLCSGKRFRETISVNSPKSVVLYKLFS